MTHMITPPRINLMYAVVDMDGTVLSWHRTSGAAQHAIDAEYRRFRRRYPLDGSRGNATAYLPRSIIHCADGISRSIARDGEHSTGWA